MLDGLQGHQEITTNSKDERTYRVGCSVWVQSLRAGKDGEDREQCA